MPELIIPMPARRLIGPDEMAKKLGYSRDWLYRNRMRLETLGFPRPILGGNGKNDSFLMRWDEKAIELWLDMQMPEQLKRHANDERINIRAIDARAAESRLANKARELSL